MAVIFGSTSTKAKPRTGMSPGAMAPISATAGSVSICRLSVAAEPGSTATTMAEPGRLAVNSPPALKVPMALSAPSARSFHVT
ncbi:MAG: hypothetical protein COY42_25130 [Armatimonadetes bacterium CG_4_10_14_0_8_um_filter_66_14]|nr:MAG: hypothetical protein COS65_13825 [Armatimonadetes bacterium CG06_land_8_20_14_3_00_66_21]PIZ36627.1 MAG: hypothetical protein COY42_25130 [Armatimonadetes bacterium CG_4_10_14_0_8_um_filter_66_14]PJB72501.1 MAG: hypothetical protein CO096_07665 [Armatimonadetes bacterium CG_4_9_14_3_um_filter_66_14]